MSIERYIKLFRSGGRQVIHSPREFDLPGTRVLIRKETARLVIEPLRERSLLAVLKTWEPLDEDMSAIADLPADPVNI
jgi:antitoxin VapB